MAFTVAPASARLIPAATQLLFAHESEADRERSAARCRDALATGGLDPAGLLVACDSEGTLCGAMLVQSLPGALGLAWPPGVRSDRDARRCEDALATTARDWLRRQGVKVCQAFVTDDARHTMTALERHGFRFTTQVLHLQLDHLAAQSASPVRVALVIEQYTPSRRNLFRQTLLTTYEGSRDCPELNGSRTAEELWAAFGEPSELGWFLIAVDDTPIGLLLLDEGGASSGAEVAYLGLVPGARGQGYGDDLVRLAVNVAQAAGRSTLTLSVDARNAPARHLYRRHHFRECGHQNVFLANICELGAS